MARTVILHSILSIAADPPATQPSYAAPGARDKQSKGAMGKLALPVVFPRTALPSSPSRAVRCGTLGRSIR